MSAHILNNTYSREANPDGTDYHNVNEFNRLWLILHYQGIVGPIGSRYYKNELYWYMYNNAVQDKDYMKISPHQYLEKHMSCFYIEDMEQPADYKVITYNIKEFDRIWKRQAKKGLCDTEYGGEYHGQLAEFLSDRYLSKDDSVTEKSFLAWK